MGDVFDDEFDTKLWLKDQLIPKCLEVLSHGVCVGDVRKNIHLSLKGIPQR